MTARIAASKKTPTKKAAPPSPTSTAVLSGRPAPFEPLRLKSVPDTPVEMVDLFEVDGVMYQVPRKPSASIGLRYLEAVEAVGPQAANLFILREMLGPDGYVALSTCKTLDTDQLEWVVETIQGLALGTVEAPKA